MKSRNRKILDLYLTLRNLILGSLRSFTKTYTKDDLSGSSLKKILVIRLDRIGDMVVTTPIFRALKENLPDVHVTALTNPVNNNIVINNPFIDCILVYDRENKHKSFNSRLTFFRSIRERKFDLVIDPYLDYELKTSFITRFVGNGFRLGFEFAGRGLFYNIRYNPNVFPVSTEKKHMIDYDLDLLTCIGVETEKRQPEIFLSSEEKAYNLLKKAGVNPEDRVIGIHPGGHYESQRWPINEFAAISDYLITHYGIKVILFAGREEKQLISEFKGHAAKAPVILEDLSLREFMSALSYCSLFLCNNSGPLHIATALNIPTVSTMGPTIPYHWWPRGKNHIVLREDVDCSPCKKGICETHECMKLITTNDFIAAVERQIKDLNISPSTNNSLTV
ncbi:MAG: glycosyltransferase family 9 protein [Candidatus Scalindua sp.]|jgi:heptosyltransferase-2|nr:glycosyltransferase family 9 protein [Candidatus Scalindua sp.]MBT5304059.1 glycosyltransferase family 9 protein [Candidatus Scalindua sp.]MBT6052509.1 glycosyltransferase family 9 protein [Candidatus Scalindua sp.]MBT6229743.1 glycosyltransferase family 9 protein [Candidatus Scalindua sp.]MBT6562002.1 glycosyltransferase family 9 protein [Candidatus Scalindua sp.]